MPIHQLGSFSKTVPMKGPLEFVHFATSRSSQHLEFNSSFAMHVGKESLQFCHTIIHAIPRSHYTALPARPFHFHISFRHLILSAQLFGAVPYQCPPNLVLCVPVGGAARKLVVPGHQGQCRTWTASEAHFMVRNDDRPADYADQGRLSPEGVSTSEPLSPPPM